MKHALTQWLELFSTEDWTMFGHFLEMPEHSRKNLPRSLFHYLAENRSPEGPGQLIATGERELYQHLYGREPFVAQRLRRVMMDLRQLAELYLVKHTRSLLPAEAAHELRVLRMLLDHNQPHMFEERLAAVKALPVFAVASQPETFLARFSMYQMHNEWVIHTRQDEDHFGKVSEALDAFYVTRKLELFASMRTREKRHTQQHDYSMRDEVLAMAQQPSVPGGAITQLWLLVLRLEEGQGSDAVYHDLQQLLDAERQRLQPMLLRQFRGYMFNYLARTQQRGHRPYYEQLWDLMRSMQEEGTLHVHGNISAPFFLAAVRSACLAGDVKGGRSFFLAQKPFLIEAEKETMKAYCDAMISFYEGHYASAWKLLLTLRFADDRMETLLRVLQLQVAYAAGREDDFFRLGENFRRFIRSKSELGETFTRLYHGFGNAAEKLGRAKFMGSRITRNTLKQIAEDEMAELLWLRDELKLLV